MRISQAIRSFIGRTSVAGQVVGLVIVLLSFGPAVGAFEGKIDVTLIQGAKTTPLLYTIGPDHIRIQVAITNWPYPIDIIEQQSGALTLLYPHNRSYMRLDSASGNASASMPGMPMPPGGLPPGIGPQSGMMPGAPGMSAAPGMPSMPAPPAGLPAGVGPQSSPAMPKMPMPPMMNQNLKLSATGQTTNILGYACEQYELKQRGQTLQIWATGQLPPYQPYIQSQPRQSGPRRIEQQWGELIADKKLFPMLATLRNDSGAEHMRFEVNSISTNTITEPDKNLFEPPPGYHEVRPLPF